MNRKRTQRALPERRDERTNEVRLRYLYQDLVLRGKARISLAAATRLLGPDRAFHLYVPPSRTLGRPRS